MRLNVAQLLAGSNGEVLLEARGRWQGGSEGQDPEERGLPEDPGHVRLLHAGAAAAVANGEGLREEAAAGAAGDGAGRAGAVQEGHGGEGMR